MNASSRLNSTAIVFFVIGVTVLGSGTASADPVPPPVVYDQARAIPTRSGMNARITLYTKRVTFLRVRVDGGPGIRASKFGRGCGKLGCQKWKLYSPRSTENECYELKIIGGNRMDGVVNRMTVCEPFPDGEL